MKKKWRPLSDRVEVRVMADTSYQIKRAMEAIAHEKGMELMSSSGVRRNNRRWDENQPFLREHATFRDLKCEKQNGNQKKNSHNKKREQ